MVEGSISQMKIQERHITHACLHLSPLGRTDDVRLNSEMSEANAPRTLVVLKVRLRPKGRCNLSVDGKWGGVDISGFFALVVRILVLQKFLGNCDGIFDGRLTYSMSKSLSAPQDSRSQHHFLIPNGSWVGGMSAQTATQHVGVFDVLPPSAF